MTDTTPPGARARELAAALIRHMDEAPTEHLVRAPRYDSVYARLATGTAARKLGISVDTLAPGKAGSPYHLHHAQEEAFVILDGHGTLRVAGERLPVRAGDVIFIPPGPEYPHQIVNTSAAPLKFLSISTRESPEICEYPDSGKFAATAAADGQRHFDRIGPIEGSVDYWDGEP